MTVLTRQTGFLEGLLGLQIMSLSLFAYSSYHISFHPA